MKYVAAAVAISLGLASPALAAQQTDKQDTQNQPVLMTEAQLDAVVAGQAGNCEALVGCIEVEVERNNVGVVAVVTAAAQVLTSNSNANATSRAVNLRQIQ